MVGMEVTETYKLQVTKTRASLPEAKKTAATGVDEDAGLAVDPDNIRSRCAGIVCDWAP